MKYVYLVIQCPPLCIRGTRAWLQRYHVVGDCGLLLPPLVALLHVSSDPKGIHIQGSLFSWKNPQLFKLSNSFSDCHT
jgi:hypothetical protein